MKNTHKKGNKTNPDFKSIIELIEGTFAIEGIELSSKTKDNLRDINCSKKTADQIINEIKSKLIP